MASFPRKKASGPYTSAGLRYPIQGRGLLVRCAQLRSVEDARQRQGIDRLGGFVGLPVRDSYLLVTGTLFVSSISLSRGVRFA
jgi:hypothetical protein